MYPVGWCRGRGGGTSESRSRYRTVTQAPPAGPPFRDISAQKHVKSPAMLALLASTLAMLGAAQSLGCALGPPSPSPSVMAFPASPSASPNPPAMLITAATSWPDNTATTLAELTVSTGGSLLLGAGSNITILGRLTVNGTLTLSTSTSLEAASVVVGGGGRLTTSWERVPNSLHVSGDATVLGILSVAWLTVCGSLVIAGTSDTLAVAGLVVGGSFWMQSGWACLGCLRTTLSSSFNGYSQSVVREVPWRLAQPGSQLRVERQFAVEQGSRLYVMAPTQNTSLSSTALDIRGWAQFGVVGEVTNITISGTANISGLVYLHGAVSIAARDIIVPAGAVLDGDGKGRYPCSDGSLLSASTSNWQYTSLPWLPDRFTGVCGSCAQLPDAPVHLGAQAGSGAALVLNASTTLSVDGTVTVKGGRGCGSYYNVFSQYISGSAGGAGGSILLIAGALLPSRGQLVVHGGEYARQEIHTGVIQEIPAGRDGRVAVLCRESALAGDGSWLNWTLRMPPNPDASRGYPAPYPASLYVECGQQFQKRLRFIGGGRMEGTYWRTSPSAYFQSPPLGALHLRELSAVDVTSVVVGSAAFSSLKIDAVDLTFRNYTAAYIDEPGSGRLSVRYPVMLQRSDAPVYGPTYFSPAEGLAIVGDLISSLAAVDEVRCGFACCEFGANCTGYSFTSVGALVGGDVSWNGMSTGMTRNCFLYANVSALLPNLLVRSGLVRAALPGSVS